jgi:hypothetical protein
MFGEVTPCRPTNRRHGVKQSRIPDPSNGQPRCTKPAGHERFCHAQREGDRGLDDSSSRRDWSSWRGHRRSPASVRGRPCGARKLGERSDLPCFGAVATMQMTPSALVLLPQNIDHPAHLIPSAVAVGHRIDFSAGHHCPWPRATLRPMAVVARWLLVCRVTVRHAAAQFGIRTGEVADEPVLTPRTLIR